MSEALALLRRTAGHGLLVHGVRTLAAVGLTWPLLRGLSAAIDGHLFRAETTGVDASLVLEVIVESADLRWLAMWTGCYALLSPLLSLFWLGAMAPGGGRPALAALKLYPRALLLLLAVLPLSLPVCLPGITLALSQPMLPESLQESAALAGAGLGLLGLLTALAVHDVVRTALVQHGSLRRALPAGLRAVSPRLLLARFGILLAALLLATIGEAARELPPPLVLPAQQTCAFALTACTGLWLAHTVITLTRHSV